MHSRHSESFHGFGTVATLAPHVLADDECLGYLTVGESERLASIRSVTRKKKWLAGRMAGKYLYLNRLTGRNAKSTGDVPYIELNRSHLEFFAPSMYQGIQILPDAGSAGNIPRLNADGAPSSVEISLSHTDDLSCACLTRNVSVGIDIEQSEHRVDSFYRKNFTALESGWVSEISSGYNISPFWLYTVLWALKESALKSLHCSEASVWDIPDVEIKISTKMLDWKQLYEYETLGNEFSFFTVGIKERSGSRNAQVALTATSALILAILKPEEGVA